MFLASHPTALTASAVGKTPFPVLTAYKAKSFGLISAPNMHWSASIAFQFAGEAPEAANEAASPEGAEEVNPDVIEHSGEELKDPLGFEALISMLGKDMDLDMDHGGLSKITQVLQELTTHLDESHKQQSEGGKAHPVLKKVLSQRTHDRMVTALQKMYSDVPRQEINDQLHAVMALLNNLKVDPGMSAESLLEKTAMHLGIELTPDVFEDMKKHMGWAARLLGGMSPHVLGDDKAEEL
ncbi:hypothetical protein BESB_072300 [Besnoitia besnoiti]|uniref:Uncharacterized protein n=1 Tax=Besnoitia besnoiti TaxID=94643 RepID=A0A2A9M6H8_BESBE|nr:uncharacterized protein BESB_072300 [Besnoitia besnoiti]PFH34078.1 hypothetical protein BESB_072300 [Besnoitia besnoiti]